MVNRVSAGSREGGRFAEGTAGKKAPTASALPSTKAPTVKPKIYGSRTSEIRAVLKQMVEMTDEQETQLYKAYRSFLMNPEHPHQFSEQHVMALFARAKAQRKAYGKSMPLPGYAAAFAQAKKLVWGNTSGRDRDSVWSDAKSIQRNTLLALLSYDLIGPKGYTREHFDSQLAPWESIFGKIKIRK